MNKKNLANAQLLNSINATTTTVEVKQGQASDLPNIPFHATITPLGVLSTVDNSEIVEVTGVSTDSLTLLRGQRGTSAKEFEADALLANGIYVEDIDSKQDELVSGSNIKTVNGNPLTGAGDVSTPDTTYDEISEAEINSGTSSVSRAISGRRAQAIVNESQANLSPAIQLNASKTAVGINKVPEDGALDVDGDIYSNGRKVSIAPGFTTFNCRQSAVQSNTSTVNPKIITDTYNTHGNGGSGEISVSGNRPIKIDVSAPLYTNGSGNADLHVRIDGTDYFITTSNNTTSGGSCPLLSGSRILPAGTIDEGTYTCYMTYVGNTSTTNVSNYKEATCTIYEI